MLFPEQEPITTSTSETIADGSGSSTSESVDSTNNGGTMSELDPKEGRRSRELQKGYVKGVLIAKRDGFSLATNSIGPIWILEINQPNAENHGDIYRCFEYLGPDIMIGNPDDGATDLWFRLKSVQRTDGTSLIIAYGVTRNEPIAE